MDYSGKSKKELIDEINRLNKHIHNLDIKAGEKKRSHAKSSDDDTLKSEIKYNEFFENSPDMFFSVKPDGTVISVNETGARVLGYAKNELIGKKVWKVVLKEDLQYVKEKLKHIIDHEKEKGELEFRKICKDGTVIHVQEKTRLVFSNGRVSELRINCRDITPHKLVLENLKEQEEKFRTLTNNLNVGVYRSTAVPRGKFIEMNPAFVQMFGYAGKVEMFQIDVSELYHDAQDRIQLQRDLQKTGNVKNREVKLKKKNGDTFIGSLSTVALKDDRGNPKYYDGIVEDITEQKIVTEEILRKEQQYRTLFNLSPNGILIEDSKGNIIDANPAFCEMVGYSMDELTGMHVSELSYSSDPDTVHSNIDKLLLGEHLKHITKSRKKDGTLIYTELHERKFELDETEGIICIAEDVTERIKAQEELKQSEESYRGLFNNTTDAIYIQDSEGRFVDVNEGAVKMYGYPREYFIGKTPDFLSAPGKNDMSETASRLQRAFKGEPQIFEFWGIDKSNRVFPKEIRMNKGSYFGYDVVVVFAQDITERKAAQKSLEEKEQKLRRIFNAFPDIYFKADLEGILEEISPSVYKIAGYKPEEIIGNRSDKYYFSDKEWNEVGKRIDEKGEIRDFDTRIKCKDGRIINCSLTARLVSDDNDNPIEIEGVLRDITDRKKTELALQESNRRLTTLMDNLPGMVYRCKNDKDWTMSFVSNGCSSLTGYQQDDLIDNKKVSFNDLIHENDRHYVWSSVQKAIRERSSYRLIYRIFAANNEMKWVWEQGTGVYSNEGEWLTLEGFITDITEQKKAEEEIRKLSRSIEQSPTILIITDLQGKIEYVNPRFTKITGYSTEEVIGKNPRLLKSGKTPKETYTTMWNRLTSGQSWSGEFQNRKKNGEYYWELANIFPLKNDKGKITHYIGMKEDITQRKKIEGELIEAKEKAEESDRLKSAFLANMSHEIRTPMNSIIGFSQLLDDETISDNERSHFIDLIQNSGNDLLRLIDDIIDISKIEAGQLKVFKSQYFLDNIMQEFFVSYNEFLKTKPEKKDITIRYNPPADSKTVVYTDIDRFKQIFRNLMNNAIKFTESGLIEFGFKLRQRKQDPEIEFYVRDTGIGISKDNLDVIFQSFRQANDSDTRLYGGTGLGLTITKRMVEILGGRIWVKSVKNQGSTFYFTLPYKKIRIGYFNGSEESGKTSSNKIDFNWKNKKILIVEDDDNSFFYFKNILNKTGITMQRAVNGHDAIEMVKEHEFDLVLMDIRIPKIDGYKTTRKIKTIRENLPVIAQTAYAMEGEKQKCIESGCVDYIAKPVKINDFLTKINKHIL